MCYFDDIVKKHKEYQSDPPELRCLQNPSTTGSSKSPTNQIRSITKADLSTRENSILYIMGHKNINNQARMRADKAIVMRTQTDRDDVNLGNSYDIGLVTVDLIQYSNTIRNIYLPTGYTYL